MHELLLNSKTPTPEQAKEITGPTFTVDELKNIKIVAVIRAMLYKDEFINNRDEIIQSLKQRIAIYESDRRKEQLKNGKPKQQGLFKNSKLIFNKYNTMEPNEIGFIMLAYLSDGELKEVRRIGAKGSITEKELDFIIAMAGRTAKIPFKPIKPPANEVLIRSDGYNVSIVSVSHNIHLQN